MCFLYNSAIAMSLPLLVVVTVAPPEYISGVHACGNMEYEVNIILSGNTCQKQVSYE